jgi:hypothetical protein
MTNKLKLKINCDACSIINLSYSSYLSSSSYLAYFLWTFSKNLQTPNNKLLKEKYLLARYVLPIMNEMTIALGCDAWAIAHLSDTS